MTKTREKDWVEFDETRDLSLKLSAEFTLAAVGDIVPAKPIAQRRDAGLRAVQTLLSEADASFGNMEATLRPFDTDFDGHNHWDGPFLTQARPEVADDLARLGFDMVSFASNRTQDWGIEGQRFSLKTLRAAGLCVAGSGENLAEARGAAYCETPMGTVGLVAATAALTRLGPYGIAEYPRGKSRGRPGLNGLRVTPVVHLTGDAFEKLKDFAKTYTYAFPGQVPVQPCFRDIDADRFELDSRMYTRADTPGYSYDIDERDLAETCQSIRNAKIASNVVVVSLHYHQWCIDPENPVHGHAGQTAEIPNCVRDFASRAIKSGADIVLCHGPGDVRGIEILDGAPVFYGLGNFIRQPYVQNIVPRETLTAQNRPSRGAFDLDTTDITDNEIATAVMPRHPRYYFESVIAKSIFGPTGLRRIELHPIDLSFDAPISDVGIPRPATGDVAQRILDRLADRCAAFGTRVTIKDGIGVIDRET